MLILQIIDSLDDHPDISVTLELVTELMLKARPGCCFMYGEFSAAEYPFIIGMSETVKPPAAWCEEHDAKMACFIYLREGLSDKEYRFVACKEMVHLSDPRIAQTSSLDDIHTLSEEILFPPVAESLSPHATNDNFANLVALAILFPMGNRNHLKPYYDDKTVSAGEISDLIGLEPNLVEIAMSASWPLIRQRVLDQFIDHEGDREEAQFFLETTKSAAD